MPKLINIEKTR